MYTIKLNIGSWTTPVIGSGYVLANPFMEGVRIIKSRDRENKHIVRIKVDGEFIFYDDPKGNSEYDVLKTLYDDDTTTIEAKIYYDDSERVAGQLMMLGEYDTDKKTCSLYIDVVDEYSEFLKNLNTEINIKNIPPSGARLNTDPIYYTISLPCTALSIEAAKDYYLPNGLIDPEIGRNENWAYFIHLSTVPCSLGNIYTFYNHYFWFEVDTKFPSDLWGSTRWLSTNDNPTIEAFSSFIKLYDIIDELIEVIDDSIIRSEATYCDYYNVENTNYQYILIADKSDVKRPAASNPAAFENMSMEQLLGYLKKMTNVTVNIDSSGVFSLIQSSNFILPSFLALPKHDLTALYDCTKNQNKFGTMIENKRGKETWGFEDSEYTFENMTIDYLVYNKENRDNVIKTINNNVTYLKTDPDDAEDGGLTFVACTKSGTTYTMINTIASPFNIINGYFTPELLFYQNFKEFDRPYSSAYAVELDENITTVREKDKLSGYNIPVYDINEIDFDYLVKSDLGNLIPESFDVDITKRTFSKFVGVA